MTALKGSETHVNLVHVFSRTSQANRRFLFFAKLADIEGFPEIAAAFRETAESETNHAHDLLKLLVAVGDPATEMPIGPTTANLRSAMASEQHDRLEVYPQMAEIARREGFEAIAAWYEAAIEGERDHVDRFEQLLKVAEQQ